MHDQPCGTVKTAVLPKVLAGAFLFAAAAWGCRDGQAEKGPAWVEIAGRRWNVKLAVSQAQRTDGLAGVRDLAEDEGMLFIFPRAEVQKFWMRGCLIPLDVAFIDERMQVVAVHTMRVEAEGAELPTYSSGVPVLFALEVGAGGLAAAGVRTGDTVAFSPGIWHVTKGRGRP